jgi:hypothetical protein
MHRTLNDIRTDGLAALRTRLGRAGMIRFLQQFDPGQGDYTQQRHDWLERTSLDDLRRLVRQRKRRGRRKNK